MSIRNLNERLEFPASVTLWIDYGLSAKTHLHFVSLLVLFTGSELLCNEGW